MTTKIKGFAEMQATAHRFHPFAHPVLVDGVWQIHISTDFTGITTLPVEFEGSPAAAAFATPEGEMNKLLAWAEKKGHEGKPLELIANHFNIDAARGEAFWAALDVELAKQGLPSEAWMSANWHTEDAITNEIHQGYWEARGTCREQVFPRFDAQHQALENVYNHGV